jgi:hypothetical protein
VNESIPCAFSGSGDAFERLIGAVSEDGSYHAVQVAPDRLQFARTFRPTWAIVVGAITVPIALLGVVFLLIKSTETCLAVVEADHRGTRVRLAGKLSSAALGRVRVALGDGNERPAQPGAIGRPVASAFEAGGARPSFVDAQDREPDRAVWGTPDYATPQNASVAAPISSVASFAASVPLVALPVVQSTAPIPVLLLDDGRRLELTRHNLLGRDPVGAADEGAAQLITVLDESRSVSKTHLAISYLDGAWHVVDRHSTNGVNIVGPDGIERAVRPGESTEVPAGSTVRFGARSLRIVGGAS